MATTLLAVGALAFNVPSPTRPVTPRTRPMTLAMPWETDSVDVKSLVKKHDITIGEGEEAKKGSMIKFDFASRVVDGAELDSAQGVQFELGKVDVLPGWVEGLSGMKPGGMRKVTLTEELWKDAQPKAIKDVPKGVGVCIEFDFTMTEVTPKGMLESVGIANNKQNLILGSLILLIGLYEGFLALQGGDGSSMPGM